MHALQHAPLVAALALALMFIEMVWRTRVMHRGYDFAGAAASLGVLAGNLLASGLAAALIIAPVFALCWSLAPAPLPIDDGRVWAIGFFAVDFMYYWEHRASHMVRWLWATHAVHHTPETLALPSAVRLGWTGALSGGWLFFAPLILVGFPPLMIATLIALNLRYQFWLHTELVGKLGPLEWIFNTPSHHRVHHASNEAYLDRNFGGILIIFDRLFGTFAQERADIDIRYGLTTPLRSNNPIVIALHEWVRLARDVAASKSVSELTMALIGRPGARARLRCEGVAPPPGLSEVRPQGQ